MEEWRGGGGGGRERQRQRRNRTLLWYFLGIAMELCNPDLKRQERKGGHSRDRCTPPPPPPTHTHSLFLSSYSHTHTLSLLSPPLPTHTHTYINEGQKRCLTKKKTKRNCQLYEFTIDSPLCMNATWRRKLKESQQTQCTAASSMKKERWTVNTFSL